jgi:hypothetical protein
MHNAIALQLRSNVSPRSAIKLKVRTKQETNEVNPYSAAGNPTSLVDCRKTGFPTVRKAYHDFRARPGTAVGFDRIRRGGKRA